MRAVLESSRRLPPRSVIARDEQFGWCVSSADGDLIGIDDHLQDLARFRLPEDALGSHAVSPDLRLAAISARSRVVAIDRTGRQVWEMPHPAWGRGDSDRGACWFSADGRYVWAHVPTASGPDEWLLLDAKGGLLGTAPLSCHSAGSRVVRHPDANRVGLSVGEGQDGSETYFGRVDGGQPFVERLDDRSRVLVSFSPDGDYFLTTPHSIGPLQLHRVVDRTVVASLEPESAFDDEEAFDLFGGFVSEDLLLFTAEECDDVFVAQVPTLDNIESIAVPDRGAGEFVEAVPGGFLTSDWVSGQTTVWRLSR